MPHLYSVTFKFNLPIRPNKTVEVTGENKEEVLENAHVAASKRGVIFGEYAYNEKPLSVSLVKENV
ncbi:MAG: hypothetical protein DRJ15_17425 [Bacteroidetes bacterium]|nr:MAG: hypothetical protein DRJ15_17425 [Bacteroidota bacterium]